MALSHRTLEDLKQIENNTPKKAKVFIKITPETSAIEQEYPYHQANFTKDKFIKFLANQKNLSLVYQQSIYQIVKYNKLKRPNDYRVFAVLREVKNSSGGQKIREIRILQFTTKDNPII
eukprot:246269_1